MTRRRAGALFAASALLHLAVFAWIARTAQTLRLPPELAGPVTTIQLERSRRQAVSRSEVAAPSKAVASLRSRAPSTAPPSNLAGATVPAPPPTTTAATAPHSCAREVLMLLTADERRECEARAAAAAALASRGFKPADGDATFSQMRPEVRPAFEDERARKLARRDVDAGAAQLAEAQADRLRRLPPGLSGRTGAEGVIRVECSIRFSAWKIQGDPKCRLGASAGN